MTQNKSPVKKLHVKGKLSIEIAKHHDGLKIKLHRKILNRTSQQIILETDAKLLFHRCQ